MPLTTTGDSAKMTEASARYEELKKRKCVLQRELRRRQGFPRHRKRFDHDEDEELFQNFVAAECEKREQECRDIQRECDELYQRKLRQLARERDELYERERQKIDVRYEELFDQEYKRIERQVDQRAMRGPVKERELTRERDRLPQNLTQYLKTCHALHTRFQKTPSRSLITQKEALSWTFPRRIIPWDGFAKLQESVWSQLPPETEFCTEQQFPSIEQLDSVRRTLMPVNSEASLQHFGRYAIENVVQELMDKLYEDGLLWNGLGLSDDVKVTIETDKDLGQVYEPMLESSWHKDAGELKLSMRNSHRRAKRAGIWVNRSCVYRHKEDHGTKTPIFAIVHQLPHRLQLDEIKCGLASEIRPERDVIDKEGDSYAFASRTLVAATVTQLYSYMISKDIQYGCVCTGEAFIFCRISEDDPCTMYCTPCVPEREVLNDDPTRLQRTAGALVFGLVLQALRARPLPESWCESVTYMDTWTMGYDDVLDRIRKTCASRPQSPSSFEVYRWQGFKQSPLYIEMKTAEPKESEKIRSWLDDVPGRDGAILELDRCISGSRPQLTDQPYCSQSCLLGLVQGGAPDVHCPNAEFHGPAHLDYNDFLRLLLRQLVRGDGQYSDSMLLRIDNTVRSLRKVRLTSHGYTFIAKGGKSSASMWAEMSVYDQMAELQGDCVPVCLGLLDLGRPWRYGENTWKEMLLLSWGGRPFLSCHRQVDKEMIAKMTDKALEAIHELGVVYNGGLAASNFLFDRSRESVMLVDFGEASLDFCKTPAVMGDWQTRKRKRYLWQEEVRHRFMMDSSVAMATIRSAQRKGGPRFGDDESDVDDSVSRC
ncbi:hypothetical protein V8C44DRAFT_323855 [Trichoderma aethiopicum]